MADQCDLCLLGLIILSSLLTGTSGVDDENVFISSGENIRLPCNNALSDCKSTTWTYNSFRHSRTVELITEGKKKKDAERYERLSLGSDCSLNIKNVTEEDYGSYICQQYVNGQNQGTDARVYLHVLHVSISSSSSSSSSSSQTEISPGRSVTLSCQLYSYTRVSCDYWLRSEGLQLLWVNQAGVHLMTDSRYQILLSSYHCIINLTTTLLNEDDNREWRCQLTLRNQLQTSVRYTVKYSVDSTTLIPVSSSNSEKKSSQTTAAAPTCMIVIIVTSFAVLLPALILWMIRRKRDDNRRGTDDSEVRCDDKVTYASIRGAKAGSQENCSELYASVNKNHHKSVK
ncbi:hypothetical protein DPX16_1904 [Anabarilius grahami]|uniref:Ig-like domain-containing protein n=1 Tax=Anabarilius grahami TaxID=495550 RepID=A0A3N0Z2V8_ANAGA|nr:hypothetical protein DPX16_1904 [Anabarilius grahami]